MQQIKRPRRKEKKKRENDPPAALGGRFHLLCCLAGRAQSDKEQMNKDVLAGHFIGVVQFSRSNKNISHFASALFDSCRSASAFLSLQKKKKEAQISLYLTAFFFVTQHKSASCVPSESAATLQK